MPIDTIEILLVEDNPADIRLAKETLKDYKMQNTLHVVQDGDAALAYVRREGEYANARLPDLILLDVALPKVDGPDVLRQIRADERLRHLPIVLMTASKIDEQMVRSLDVEADCCILKPLTLERFLDAVRCFPNLGLSIVKIATA
jgi:two-component system, chemotaxis family, response regulator Rcp1